MKHIQTSISLEPMTSRLPSVLPAYKDNKLYFFDKESIDKRAGLYTSNYGMIPINICLDKFNGCGTYTYQCGVNVISWERFSEYFHFFTEYYRLLQTASHCGIVYSSATQYYDNEYYTKYADQLWYGSDRETYVELDELFEERGGCVSVTEIDCGITVKDNGIFKFFKEYIVPSFDIPQEYIDYWNITQLYYPSVIEWISWFYPRVKLYENVSSLDKCAETDNCCDCAEYINRGGKLIYSQMVEWYNGIQKNILKDLSEIKDDDNKKCYLPNCLKQVQLTNDIYDLGQETTLAEEYQLGVDYRHGKYGDLSNTSGGTVVSLSGTSLVLKEGHKGFTYNNELLEKLYDEDSFDSYTDMYVSKNASSFTADNYSYYAYNGNNEKITGKTKADVEENLSIKYPITKIDAYVHNNTIYEIQSSEYGYYKLANGKQRAKILIHRETNTNTPFIQMGTKNVFADFQVKNGVGIFTFANIFKENGEKWTASRNVSSDTIQYISVNETIMSIQDCEKTTNLIPFYRITGHTVTDDETLLYTSGNSVFTSDTNGIFTKEENAKSDKQFAYLYMQTNPTIYESDVISGLTTSKLNSLRALQLMTDDAGNTLNGIRNTFSRDEKGKISTFYTQPIEGDSLEPIYQVGNTANILPYKYTITDMDFYTQNSDVKTNYFVGDIITDMTFYYKYYPDTDSSNTEIIDEKIFTASTVCSCSDNVSALAAISASTKVLEEVREYYPNMRIDETIKCDITYYIGATLCRTSNGTYLLNEKTLNNKLVKYIDENVSNIKGDNGIRYTETLEFVKETTQYYLRKPTTKELQQRTLSDKNDVYYAPLSYPIYTYKVVQQTQDFKNSDGETVTYPMANFYCKINTYKNKRWKYEDYDCETYNNMQVFPTYREEYLHGIGMMPNVDADIYIDRGINAAFEKHLKLGEVTSLESLENYTNGYYKMMEN